ncbi:hypothetical protein MN032_00980 [Agromyces atrinae]|uniref:hypothetical protein n=1 Tax=Agromyces atrinae TaxID=592376 RepID=UPI001F5AF87C|nr:hypothetical protein [Agromyces atrinae]MCI2956248.1 hypothetical protein [Agromyces atrinae]
MKRALVIAVAAASLVLAGCSADGAPTPEPTEPAAEQLFTITGTLFDDKRDWEAAPTPRPDGPQICWLVLQPNPPGCGSGMGVDGFDWDELGEGVVAHGDPDVVRWADVRLVGTFDGERLRLTEPPSVWGKSDPADAVVHPPGDLDPTELSRIQQEIQAAEQPPISGQGDGFVTVTVMYDEDGALQKRLDATYGVGVVYVESLLTPVP